MAERGPDDQLIQDENFEKLSDQLIEYFSGLNIDSNGKLDDSVVTILEGKFENLKCLEARKTLEDWLFDIDKVLVKLESANLDVSNISLSHTGDLMVCGDKTMNGIFLEKLNYTQEERGVYEGQDQLYLSNEPALCYKKLMVVRKLIVECLRIHTEIYLMAQDISELIENFKVLNLDMPKFPDLKFERKQLGEMIIHFSERLAEWLYDAFIRCCEFLQKFNVHLLPLCRLGIGGAVFLATVFGVLAGWAWVAGRARREPLEQLYKFRMKLENSEIEAHLNSVLTLLSTNRDETKEKLFSSESSVSLFDYIIFFKSYKQYMKTFEKSCKKRPNLSDGEIHANLREWGGTACIDPLMEKFKITEEEAWKLIDVIHGIATRK